MFTRFKLPIPYIFTTWYSVSWNWSYINFKSCLREADSIAFESEMNSLQEEKKKLDREIRNVESTLDGHKNKVRSIKFFQMNCK